MLCSLLDTELLGFLHRSVRAMGCFFGCFRVKDAHRPSTHLVSQPAPNSSREPVESRNPNRLSTLLLSEDDERDTYPCKDKETHVPGSPPAEIDVGQLKDEAKFLKAWGTLTETPGEIRKASTKLKDFTPQDSDTDSQNFQSWFASASIQKLNLDTQHDQSPTPMEHGEGITHKPATSSDSPKHNAENEQGVDKSVRFDRNTDPSSISSKENETAGNHEVSKRSPYPTPVRLSNDIETPGTVFPANLESLDDSKKPQIRSQYVYPVLNPIKNKSQWEVLKEEDSDSSEGSIKASLEEGKEHSEPEMFKVEESLSSWLKPKPVNGNGTSHNCGSSKSNEDRPIIGMVAAHWNEAEVSHVSPKWWDGNGIPNSTTKYKEDQKVSWHATPFEERLEKALSEETFSSQRKNLSGTSPVNFDETEERDTALSQLRTSSTSVISF